MLSGQSVRDQRIRDNAAPPQANTVPEPESLVLVAMALGVAVGLRVRRSSQRARKDESRRDGE